MTVPIFLVLVGVAGLMAKVYVLRATRERLALAREKGIDGYLQRSGETAWRLQVIVLLAMICLTGISAISIFDPLQRAIPLTGPRLARGVLFVVTDLLLVAHAFYTAWRYAGDLEWEPPTSASTEGVEA